MKALNLLLITCSMAGILTWAGCKEEPPCNDPNNPDCANYDPCYGKRTINTFFKVRPGDNGFKPPEEWCDLIPCDTFNASSVRFDAPDGNPENSTYEWQIGTELEPRSGKAFEIDFSDYLSDNGWERHIPITLTIRTPMNSCLTNLKDTLVSVTRELFFTQKPIHLLEPGETAVKYKGYFAHEPNKEVVMEFIQLETGSFRGINAPVFITVGLPNIDSLAFRNCRSEACSNYKHSITKVLLPYLCEPLGINPLLSEWVFIKGRSEIYRMFEFEKENKKIRYEFHGTKM